MAQLAETHPQTLGFGPDSRTSRSRLEIRGQVQAGDILGERYELEEMLGEGAMGQVWRARHRDLDAAVAIKVLRAEVRDELGAERLRQEARAIVRVKDPNVVNVTDFGVTASGNAYFVMEHLEGESLADVLDRDGAIEPHEAVRMLLPVIRGLAAAHDAGLVHRDIKPDNIFVAQTKNGVQPKLLDFGVAIGSEERDSEAAGHMVGTPYYMPPEQCEPGASAVESSDIWSLGVVLFEMVTGDIPFAAQTIPGILNAVLRLPHARPASLYQHERELALIVDRCLDKNPKHRFRSARELGLALSTWLEARGVRTDIEGVVVEREPWIENLSARRRTMQSDPGIALAVRPANAATEDEARPSFPLFARLPRKWSYAAAAALAVAVVGGFALQAGGVPLAEAADRDVAEAPNAQPSEVEHDAAATKTPVNATPIAAPEPQPSRANDQPKVAEREAAGPREDHARPRSQEPRDRQRSFWQRPAATELGF